MRVVAGLALAVLCLQAARGQRQPSLFDMIEPFRSSDPAIVGTNTGPGLSARLAQGFARMDHSNNGGRPEFSSTTPDDHSYHHKRRGYLHRRIESATNSLPSFSMPHLTFENTHTVHETSGKDGLSTMVETYSSSTGTRTSGTSGSTSDGSVSSTGDFLGRTGSRGSGSSGSDMFGSSSGFGRSGSDMFGSSSGSGRSGSDMFGSSSGFGRSGSDMFGSSGSGSSGSDMFGSSRSTGSRVSGLSDQHRDALNSMGSSSGSDRSSGFGSRQSRVQTSDDFKK